MNGSLGRLALAVLSVRIIEYRLVQKQREHALQSWEEKIRVYEKALGIRICQQEGSTS